MQDKPGIIHRVFTGVWTLVDQLRRSIVNILFLLFVYFIVKAIFFTESPKVPTVSALVLEPEGYIVDERDYINPVDEAIDQLSEESNQIPQTLLKDLVLAINTAKQDSNINSLVLNLGSLYGAGPSKLQDIAEAIGNFKTSGKPVYAYSAFYNQAQYYIASHADEVYMDSLGSVYIEGYGRFNTYFKGALDKLGINFHIFKVGTYKSAVEPFIRNDMSTEAKEANLYYLGDLWDSYTTDVALARDLPIEAIQQYSDNYLSQLATSNKSPSEMAVSDKLIDALMTEQEFKHYLIEKVGSNNKGTDYKKIRHQAYVDIIDAPSIKETNSADNVAIIVAKGVIYNGTKKAGSIGGKSTSKLIRRARLDNSVKALVLRVDSQGGSAYASEIIRREIVQFRESGKPVVVSMGSYAASGGYWISTSANEIWASPTTITGSIGIFGMLPTFEKPLNDIGIFRDGVGTTRLTGAFDAGKPLRADVGKAIQSSIDKGYSQFLKIVSEGREMTIEEVDKVAQGRVWSGQSAQKIGLVDHLGGIEQAIDSAANLAGLVDFNIKYIQLELTESEHFFKTLFNNSIISNIKSERLTQPNKSLAMLSPAMILLQQVKDSYETLKTMNDPQNLYVHCLCAVN